MLTFLWLTCRYYYYISNTVSINVTSKHGHMTCCFTLVQRHNHWSGLLCFFFSSLSLRPEYPCLLFPPTLPIILDVITNHNLTHKGKRRLRLATDPSRTLWSSSHWELTDGPVFACLWKHPFPEIMIVFCQIDRIWLLLSHQRWTTMFSNKDNRLPGKDNFYNVTSKMLTRHQRCLEEHKDIELRHFMS